MSEEEKNQVAQRLTARVSTGLHFIELEYLDRHSHPDPAFIRNIYILLSFYSELLLKSIFIIKKDFTDLCDLDMKLRDVGHNLETIGEKIGESALQEFGILNILFINKEYLIKTNEKDFYVKDFTDIRYDFLDDKVRKIKGDEHEVFRNQINTMRNINKKLEKIVW